MPDDFIARTNHLLEQVGTGPLVGTVVVDQVYARYQHEGLDLKHPEGGSAKYLEAPLLFQAREYTTRLSKDAITEDGSKLETAMAEDMEDLSRQVYENAPFEFGDLKASGHPIVTSDGHTVYDRPPNMHRLTEEELRIKGHLRSLGIGNV